MFFKWIKQHLRIKAFYGTSETAVKTQIWIVIADDLTESIRPFGDKSDILFAAHGIPRFGREEIVDFLSKHHDAHKFLHDQTLGLMNAGLTGSEISELLRLPKVLAKQWFNRGHSGTMSHDSKAVYQRYMGWYDANPARLSPLPPEPGGKDVEAGVSASVLAVLIRGSQKRRRRRI